MICGMTSCTPINSLSVELRATSFCPVSTLYMEPYPLTWSLLCDSHDWVDCVGGVHAPPNDTAAIRFQLALQILCGLLVPHDACQLFIAIFIWCTYPLAQE